MMLVTKCPHCHTAFKVTMDQLNLYDGAVRCGICQQIFNGTDHLQQTESITPHDKKEVFKETSIQKEPTQEKPLLFDHDDEELSISLSDEDINALPDRDMLFHALEDELSTISLELEQVTGELFDNDLTLSDEEEETESLSEPLTSAIKKTDKIHFPKKPSITTTTSRYTDLSLYPNLAEPAKNRVYSIAPHLDDVANVSPSAYIETVEADDIETKPLQKSQFASAFYHELDNQINAKSPSSYSPDIEKKEQPAIASKSIEPKFIKTAPKKWSGIFSNILLIVITLFLLCTLSIQCLYMFSDRMIIWWPPSEPIISKACETLSCPRRLETRISALTIESSELQIIPELKNKYALSLLIRNSSSSYQSWPYIELTLTDQEKKTIIRKIFAPANYLPNANSIMKGIPPYAEKSVGLYLEMKTESNADYRISLFYP